MAQETENIIDELAGPEEAEVEKVEPEKVEPETEPEVKTVPLPALHESREQTRMARAETAELRDKIVTIEALFDRFQKGQKTEGPVVPSFEDDPEGHLRGTMDAMRQRLDGFETDSGKRREQDQTQATEQQLLERYAGSVRAFTVDQPDFQQAYNYLSKAIDAELQLRGYTDPGERSQVMQYEEGRLAGRALRAGEDPAKMIYDLAKHRGYKGEEKSEGEDKLDRLKKGAEASKSLSGTGAKGEGAMTLERLSELADSDPEAFDREFEKAKRQGLLG